MRIGEIMRTGDNRLGRLMKSNGEFFHYLWIFNEARNRWSMDKFHVNEFVPATEVEIEVYKEIAKRWLRTTLNPYTEIYPGSFSEVGLSYQGPAPLSDASHLPRLSEWPPCSHHPQ